MVLQRVFDDPLEHHPGSADRVYVGLMGLRMYGDLAPWWPLFSAVEDYEEEAAFAADLLRSAEIEVREVLELGSGGGHNASHLKAQFDMTLVDLSPDMLRVSQAANPELEHVVGDMRDVRLGRTFDAVFVHDAVAYMTSREDLSAVFGTAFVHLRPGGVAVFTPDEVTETFEPATEHGGHDDPATGRGIRYLEWSWDPDPLDETVTVEYAVVVRDADGNVSSSHESHVTGLFPTATWLDLLSAAGFVPEAITEVTTEDREPRICFVAKRPM